ncbi:MAG: hypothetical protein ACKN87_01255 [Microcystis aeruginosa]
MTRIEQKFYPLTAEISQKLRHSNLTAAEWRLWSYLVELDPFGDRYSDLPDTFTIMQAVNIKKTTFYTAIAKFQQLGLFDFQDQGFSFRNLRGVAKRGNQVRFVEKVAENSENDAEKRNPVRGFGNFSENSENQAPKPLQQENFAIPQTIQTIQTIQTVAVGDLIFPGEKEEKDLISRDKKVIVESESIQCSNQIKEPLRSKLDQRLGELGIPLDQKIREAIDKYGQSRAWQAIAHVEATLETIRSKYGVFLYQISKEPPEQPRSRLSDEFLRWYAQVRGEIVEDVALELLPLDRYGEPLLRLRHRPDELIPWRRVADKDSERSPLNIREMLESFPLLKSRLGRKKNDW